MTMTMTAGTRWAVAAGVRSDLYLTRRDGGCKADGIVEDTAAISAAMDAANTAGKVLFFEPGNYLCGAISKSYAPKIDAAPGVTITAAASTPYGWVWSFAGAIGAHQALTGNMVQRSFTLPAPTAGWAANDLLLVASNKLVPDEAYPATVQPRYVGQLAEILSVDGAGQATLIESAYTDLLTADTAFAAKVTPIENPRVMGGMRFVNPYRTSKNIGFLSFLYARDVEFDIRGDGASMAGVNLRHCFRVTGRSRHRNYNHDTAGGYYGYGVAVVASTAHGTFDITAVGGGNAWNTTGYDNDWGEPNDHRITGTAAGGVGGFTTHPAGRNITFHDCHVSGIGRGFGFGARCDGVQFIDCTVDRAGGGIWLFDNARNVLVEGCTFREIYDSGDASANGRAIIFTQTAAAGERNITIRNNRFVGVDRNCITLSDNSGSLSGVEIAGNRFRNFGRTGGNDADTSAIYNNAGGTTVSRWVVKDNICDDYQAVPTGKWLINSNAAGAVIDIYDNDVRDGIGLSNRVLQGAARRYGRNVINGKSTETVSDYTGIGSGTLDCLTTDFFYVPLTTASRTLVFANPTQGQTIELHLAQDGTGGRAVVWPGEVKFPANTAPTLSGLNKTDIFRFRYRGTSWYLIGQVLNL